MNPILPSRFYIPDVEARQWADGTIYLYGSRDNCGSNAYCSKTYTVFSSKDMKNWTAHDAAFSSVDVPDCRNRDKALYAPDCQKIGDSYCLFYCQEDASEGVAFSKYPFGPFSNAQAIEPADKDKIDPAILVDDDGSLYYFWGQTSARGGRLDLNTKKIVSETFTENILTEKEHGFHEGISIRKRNDTYYLVYADISRGRPTCLGYAVSRKPLGPYTKKGIIIDNSGCDPKSWNNHGSIEKINGNWYVFYHRATHNSHFSRHVCIEPIFFNTDGTINEVEMTTQGIEGPLDCMQILAAHRACQLKGKCYIDDYHDDQQNYEYLANIHPEDVATFKYLNFAKMPEGIEVEAACSKREAIIQVYLDQNESDILAELPIQATGGSCDFQKFAGTIRRKDLSGVHSLHLKVKGEDGLRVSLKTIRFYK